MLGQPRIGNYLLQLYLALVLLDTGGLEADQLAWWRAGSIPGTRQAMSSPGIAANRKDLQIHSVADDKVQMFKFSTWTGASQPQIQLPNIKNMQKRDLTNSSRLAEFIHFPVNNAQTKVTTTENLTQSLDQSVKYKMCLHSQAGSDGCRTRAEPFARQICVYKLHNTRVNKLLFHPSFPSRCWTPSHGACPPPILKNDTLRGLLSDDTEECVQTAVQVLCEIVQVNARIERAEQVMDSGFCTGATSSDNNINSGGTKNSSARGNQTCDEGDSSTYTRCKNCLECKVKMS